MTARQEAIIVTLMKVGKKHNKRYSFPTQKTILRLLKAFHGYEISERTLRRDLRDLEENNYIKTTHRKRLVQHLGRWFTSNLYKFQKKVFIWLNSWENRAKHLFRWFHRPILAVNIATQKQAFTVAAPASGQKSEEKVSQLPPEQFKLHMSQLINGFR